MVSTHVKKSTGLFLQEKYSDFVVVCGGQTFPAHRAIVCPQSHFFDAALGGNFMEAKTRTLTLNDEDPETVKRMLSYLYTDDYEQEDASEAPNNETKGRDEKAKQNAYKYSASRSADPPPPASIGFNNIKVYVTAEKFGIEPLKEMALRRFVEWYEDYRGDQFAEATRQALESPPPHDRDLREAIVDEIKDLAGNEHEWVASNDALLDVLGQCDALKEVFKAVVSFYGVGVTEDAEKMEALQLRVRCSICG